MAAMKAGRSQNSAENSALAARLARETSGEVLFDAFSRGRYATDASFYQIMPLGVVIPRTMDDALRTLAIARDEGRIVTPRGGGTSQCGQTITDGTLLHFGEVPRDLARVNSPDRGLELFREMLDLGEREAAEIAERFPKVQRRVGGYNLDALVPRNAPNNMAHLLVGSEGTLAFTTKVELKLWPVIRN